jgi:insertion element IS1 protein InsB
MNREVCPDCGSGRHKKNGHIHNGKQNYRCKDCDRQFVADCEFKSIGEETRELIKKALLERNSLRGICRIFGVSLTWLLGFVAALYVRLPTDLGLNLQINGLPGSTVRLFTVEADEMWSFVAKKSDKQGIWIAIDAKTRQVIAFHVGDRSKESAKRLWHKIPETYRKQAVFHTDLYESYMDSIPQEHHLRVTKQTGLTNHIERFNGTMRQRVSRLVRDSLAFSKKLANHIGAIHYFICHYNQTRQPAALHV